MPPRRIALSALVALPVLLAAATPAAAAGGLAPGGSEMLSVVLPPTWAAQADRLGVSVVDLVQAENECLKPEYEAGDRTCADDGGDLAGQLLATVAAGTLDGGSCIARGPFVPLDLLHPDAQARLAVAGVECLSLGLSFPDGDDDNLAQSDSLTFRLRAVAEGPEGIPPGTPNPAAQVARSGDPASAAAARPGRSAGQRGGTTTVGAGQAPAGTGDSGNVTVATGDDGGNVLGEQTSAVDVSGGSTNVQTEAATSSIGDLVVIWGAGFLGVVMVGFLLFRWSAMRRRPARSAA